ncbi:Hint domain-containing protein [Roseovarius sp. SCSIO 43702]|uniref:Hint domain-containing protein n=1 Tax=Roseovarius sp. SCSIO 43702 TaxID=2823043 RepID=UPI001C73BBB4|nr:Hint domain-containing protein [Roseovarius sp. SCSIO 43702]QYX56146.1 Hint domain-containing protein [Roseovarius sp. SCSIO 43702]
MPSRFDSLAPLLPLPGPAPARRDMTGDPAVTRLMVSWLVALDGTTSVLTRDGMRPAGELSTGDHLVARGGDEVALLATHRLHFRALGDLAPIEFGRGVFGATAATRLPPAQRLLLEGWRAQQACGQVAALFAAGDLVNGISIRRCATGTVTSAVCLVPERSATVSVNGLWIRCRGLDDPDLPGALRAVLPPPDPFMRPRAPLELPLAGAEQARAICDAPP